jgi:hypothetical protein
VSLGSHAEQVHIEIRNRLTGRRVGCQQLLVGQRRRGQVVAEFAVAGRHRMHLAGRDVDVGQQRGPRLFVVALVVVLGDVAFVAPEQMHACPVDVTPHQRLQQPDAVAATGQHHQRSAAGRHGACDGVGQSRCGGFDHGLAIRENFDAGAHTYCTFSMPSSADW